MERGLSVEAGHPDSRALIREPDPHWEAFAAREPYFAVLTAPKFLRANLTPEHERDFFASGEALVDWMFRLIERVSPGFSPMSLLEYGCGPGRVAIPLARRPGAITAVDRSPAMLAAARLEAERRGLGHIDFRTPDALFGEARKFDFISCIHVLQRLAPPDGLALMRALMQRLATGGIAVFHVPYRSTAGAAVQSLRWMREHLPLANGIVNTMRRTPFSDPYIPAHTYNLDDVLRLFDETSASDVHLVYQRQQELSTAIAFAHVPLPMTDAAADRGRPLPGTRLQVEPPDAGRSIAVKDVIADASIDDLNHAAEQYFASLTDWDDHLAKPFSVPGETPRLLADAAALLHGARLVPGATVLEFGAGTGWLSRWLTQLGCRMILVDVSETALRIARELYARLPVVGDRPAPRFLVFDGRRIDLPDESVDRIITFDAFHHVANPDEVLREFGRVLKPGGIAAFAEPGARHSDSPMSQFEMRTYRVVENDIDVHGIWRTARACGFKTITLAVFHGPPFHVSLDEFEDFLADGTTVQRWLTSTRVFLRNARHFFLVKAGEETVDSRTAAALACEVHARLAGPVSAGRPWDIDVTVTNTGRARWLPHDAPYGAVAIGAHLYDGSGTLLAFDLTTAPLTTPPREIALGETLECRLTLPPQHAGRYRIEIDCVASRVAWFAQAGSRPAILDIDITAPDMSADR